jgi:hypothetical protein
MRRSDRGTDPTEGVEHPEDQQQAAGEITCEGMATNGRLDDQDAIPNIDDVAQEGE